MTNKHIWKRLTPAYLTPRSSYTPANTKGICEYRSRYWGIRRDRLPWVDMKREHVTRAHGDRCGRVSSVWCHWLIAAVLAAALAFNAQTIDWRLKKTLHLRQQWLPLSVVLLGPGVHLSQTHEHSCTPLCSPRKSENVISQSVSNPEPTGCSALTGHKGGKSPEPFGDTGLSFHMAEQGHIVELAELRIPLWCVGFLTTQTILVCGSRPTCFNSIHSQTVLTWS